MVIPPNNNIGKSINGSSANQSETVNKGPENGRKNPLAASPAGDTKDEVTVSSQGAQLAKLEAAAQEHNGVDEARVAAVRDAIENGNYKVDSESLAEKMLGMDNLF